jgi:predicted nucleic acid-binding Zn ribbon protein
VARRDPQTPKSLLPELLGKVAKESGQARALHVLWREAVGDRIADASRPISLRGGELIIAASTPQWQRELAGRQQDLLARVQEKIGAAGVRSLRFVVDAGPRSEPR